MFSWLQRAGCQIIIGSHGRSGLGQLRLGSVATAVVPQSAIPVTVGK
ncbi:universal stress protein [Vogesella alkaliphila]|nr:universal stress protein [Vogesella alkaliphila]